MLLFLMRFVAYPDLTSLGLYAAIGGHCLDHGLGLAYVAALYTDFLFARRLISCPYRYANALCYTNS